MLNRRILQKVIGMTSIGLLLCGCGGVVGDSAIDNNNSGIQDESPWSAPADTCVPTTPPPGWTQGLCHVATDATKGFWLGPSMG
jgi:hypothetical protein